MTAPTDFEKRLIELNLTYAQIELIKQAVREHIIGSLIPTPPTREWETWPEADRMFLLGQNAAIERQWRRLRG